MDDLLSEPVEGAPLPALFSRASAVHRQLEHASPPQLERGLELCRRLVAEVRAADLFSANEDAEDLATADIKYLLAAFFLAELLNTYPTPPTPTRGNADSPAAGGPAQRKSLVEEAIVLYTAFLDSCQQYGLLGTVGKQLYLQDAQQVDQMDPSTKRAAKIEQFKANKALTTQLAALEDKRAKAMKCVDHEDGDKETGTSGLGAWDEEDERMLWGATVQQAGLRALHQRQMLKEEKELLHHALASGHLQQGASGSNARSAREEMEEERRQEVLHKLRGIAGTLATPSGRREELRSQVFRPSHNLPTRSLAEQADIEIADAQRRESSQRAQERARAAHLEALGSDEDEEELKRTRAFDDFKDMHPRGHGNSKLKPCG